MTTKMLIHSDTSDLVADEVADEVRRIGNKLDAHLVLKEHEFTLLLDFYIQHDLTEMWKNLDDIKYIYDETSLTDYKVQHVTRCFLAAFVERYYKRTKKGHAIYEHGIKRGYISK